MFSKEKVPGDWLAPAILTHSHLSLEWHWPFLQMYCTKSGRRYPPHQCMYRAGVPDFSLKRNQLISLQFITLEKIVFRGRGRQWGQLPTLVHSNWPTPQHWQQRPPTQSLANVQLYFCPGQLTFNIYFDPSLVRHENVPEEYSIYYLPPPLLCLSQPPR